MQFTQIPYYNNLLHLFYSQQNSWTFGIASNSQ